MSGLKARSATNNWLVCTESGTTIATISNKILDQERHAREFAAASDLLAALDNMLVCYRDEQDKTGVDRRAFAQARAAIAKAKQRT